MKKVLKILISVSAAFLMIFVSSCSLLFGDNQTFKNNQLKNIIYEYCDDQGRYCKFTISYDDDKKVLGDYIYEGNEFSQKIMLIPNTNLKIKDSFHRSKEINDERYYIFSNLPCNDYYVIISADGSSLRFSHPLFKYICHKVN